MLKGKLAREIGLVKRPDGSFTSTAEESLTVLLETHFPECKPVGQEEEVADREPRGDVDFITARKVKESIASFGPKKAEGSDGLKPWVLQELGQDHVEPLTVIYKLASDSDMFPHAGER